MTSFILLRAIFNHSLQHAILSSVDSNTFIKKCVKLVNSKILFLIQTPPYTAVSYIIILLHVYLYLSYDLTSESDISVTQLEYDITWYRHCWIFQIFDLFFSQIAKKSKFFKNIWTIFIFFQNEWGFDRSLISIVYFACIFVGTATLTQSWTVLPRPVWWKVSPERLTPKTGKSPWPLEVTKNSLTPAGHKQ